MTTQGHCRSAWNNTTHKAYLQRADIRPTDEPEQQRDDRKFFLYETDRIDVLRRCVDEDPFNKTEGWKSIEIRPSLKRVDTLSQPG
ncbi:YciI family protein [Burkholderia anthina]|uniref:YciI family protein n=1 Tax=Burkholderia anthina TaxID=179879 RepID=UPI0037C09495